MKFFVCADDHKIANPLLENPSGNAELIWIDSDREIMNHKNVAAYFDFRKDAVKELAGKNNFPSIPVFVSAISQTLADFPGFDQFIRINLWPGFLQNGVAEVCAKETAREKAGEVLQALGWKAQWVADTPGLVAPRILSMVINEAYFALGEGVSSKEEINIAMKLGTNYPFGPFEWANKIGIHPIYQLLQKLQETDKRYQIAPALQSEMS